MDARQPRVPRERGRALTHSKPPTTNLSLAMGSPFPMPLRRLYPEMTISCSPSTKQGGTLGPKVARNLSEMRPSPWPSSDRRHKNKICKESRTYDGVGTCLASGL